MFSRRRAVILATFPARVRTAARASALSFDTSRIKFPSRIEHQPRAFLYLRKPTEVRMKAVALILAALVLPTAAQAATKHHSPSRNACCARLHSTADRVAPTLAACPSAPAATRQAARRSRAIRPASTSWSARDKEPPCTAICKAVWFESDTSPDCDGGRDRDRTCDPYHVKVVLFR